MSVYNYLGIDGQHRGKRGSGRGGLKRGVELVHAALYHLAYAHMIPLILCDGHFHLKRAVERLKAKVVDGELSCEVDEART